MKYLRCEQCGKEILNKKDLGVWAYNRSLAFIKTSHLECFNKTHKPGIMRFVLNNKFSTYFFIIASIFGITLSLFLDIDYKSKLVIMAGMLFFALFRYMFI